MDQTAKNILVNAANNPFHVGDEVVFAPDERTTGWIYPSFDSMRIHPGDIGTVSKIVRDAIYIDDNRGGISWQCFKKADETIAREQRERWAGILAAKAKSLKSVS